MSKINRLFCVVLPFLVVASCNAEEKHGHGKHGHKAGEKKLPTSAVEIWKHINANIDKVEKTLKSGKLGEIHEISLSIQKLVKALPAASEKIVPKDKHKDLAGYVKRVSKHASNLHTFADAKKLAKSKSEFTKLKNRLALLAALYPKKISGATAHGDHDDKKGDDHHKKGGDDHKKGGDHKDEHDH